MPFTPLDSYRTVKVLSPTDVLDVQYVSAITTPHGLGFAYAVPIDSWNESPGNANGLLDVIAIDLEGIYTGGHLVASTPVQDLDRNGLLQDFVAAVVEYDRTAQGLPPLQGTVNIPVDSFFTSEVIPGGFGVPGAKSPAEYVAEEYALLAALAAG